MARVYDSTMYGPDPDSEGLQKIRTLPWAVAPLVVGRKLYGQIVADNQVSKKEITEDSLRRLTLLAALAAQAIAHGETFDMLRASKLKDEFLQRMAHIFGTTIFGVEMLLQNLRDGIANDEKATKEYLPAIARVNERFIGLAQNIVDFAALREDTRLNLEKVDLVALVDNAIRDLRGRAQERDIQFNLSFPEQALLWALDPVRAGNAVEALLDNAIKFSPKNSVIYVGLSQEDANAKIVIRDEGPGVPNEEQRFVFDNFYRASNARDEHVEGTGLGLSIVAQTMRLHGGEAEVKNCAEGGAEFTLIFPERPDKVNEHQ